MRSEFVVVTEWRHNISDTNSGDLWQTGSSSTENASLYEMLLDENAVFMIFGGIPRYMGGEAASEVGSFIISSNSSS